MNAMRAIYAACNQLGIDEQARRVIYQQVTGKTSAKEMSEEERNKVVAHLRGKGFQRAKGKSYSDKAYVRLIFALWKSCHKLGVVKSASRQSLVAFVKETTRKSGQQVDDPNWLTYGQAEPVIETLKAMERRGSRSGNRKG